MERTILHVVLDEPAAHLPNHIHIVVHLGNQQVGDFKVRARFVKGDKRIKNWLQASSAHTPIDVVRERFQVDVSGIDERSQVAQRLLVDITGRNEDVPQPMFMGKRGDISDITSVLNVL